MKNLNNEMVKHIMDNGGATFTSDLEHSNLVDGYMVSLPEHEQVIGLETAHKASLEKFTSLAKSLNGYVGTWLSKGMIYLDISVNIKDLNEALRLGKEYNQLAIYDIKNDKVIEVV